jgi:Peptidase family M28
MIQLTSTVSPRARTAGVRREVAVCLAVVAFVALLAALSVHRAGPPAAVGAGAPPTEFSSGRAMGQLRVIARNPHPVGSAEHAAVREYIMRELAAQGLEPSVQKATAVNRLWEGILRAGTVENVVTRLEGTGGGKAVMLVAHYDSWPAAFGASDDGAGVVTLLETLRALKAGPRLKNDVIFLFTDAEESGLLGANAFAEEHPWASEVGVVLNFEARGSRGPSTMFETSAQNGWLIREFAKAAPRPVSHSLAYEIYKLLPNDTDLTVLRRRGLSGLNFAYIEGLPSYHTQLDSIEELDERSLQHHGSYALALARHFGDLDLRETKAPDAVYFDLLGAALVHYPASWALPLGLLVAALYAALVAYGLRRGGLSLKGLTLGALVIAGCAALAAGVTALVWAAVYRLRYDSDTSLQGQTYHGDLYLLGFIALTVALTSGGYALLRGRVGVSDLAAGALAWWVALTAASCVLMPGASYLFTWPLLFSLAPLWLALRARGAEGVSPWGRPSPGLLAALAVGALPGVVLLSPLLYHVYTGLTLEKVWAVALLAVLLLALLVPHLSLVGRPYRWLLPGAAALACVALLAAALARPSFDAARPKPNSLFYGLDAGAGKAIWGSMDAGPDEWTARFLSAEPQRRPLPAFFSATADYTYLQAEAPVAPLAAPNAELLEDRAEGGVRTVRLRLTSPRRANVLTLFLDSKVEVLRATVNGNLIAADNTPALKSFQGTWVLRYFAVPPEGVDLTAEVRTAEPLKVRLVDLTYGLPQLDGAPPTARPAGMIPASIPSNNSTLVSKTFVF